MPRVMAVSFEPHGQLHYLDAGEQSYTVGDWVLYPTESGPEVARVVWSAEPVFDPDLNVPECLGKASEEDLARDDRNRQSRAEALAVTKQLVAQHQLDMSIKAVDLVISDDGRERLTAIYYTAPDRVDFRALVGDLARTLGSRIDLRQIGARDAARLTGGIGSCGRELCCSTFLKDVEPISMRLAKVQSMPNNPLQISGACGKLMCCLKYEHPLYLEFDRVAPKMGDEVVSRSEGSSIKGTVVGRSVPGQSITIKDESGATHRCPLESVCPSHQARKTRTKNLTAMGQASTSRGEDT